MICHKTSDVSPLFLFCLGLKVRLEAANREAVPIVERLHSLFPAQEGKFREDEEVVFEINHIPDAAPTRFPPLLMRVTQADHPMTRWIAARGELRDPMEQENTVIAFLNGLLEYSLDSHRVKCRLFPDEGGGNFLTGSAHRLLFASMCLWFAQRGRYLVHAAAVGHQGCGYVFWGPSGAGKSTVARYFSPHEVLSDDAPLIFLHEDRFLCARTPFRQEFTESDVRADRAVPVERNFFLHQGTRWNVTVRTNLFALAEIMATHIHCFHFMPEVAKVKAFECFVNYCKSIPSYDLVFPRWGNIGELMACSGDKGYSPFHSEG